MLFIAAWIAFPERLDGSRVVHHWGWDWRLTGRRFGFPETFPELGYQANFLALLAVCDSCPDNQPGGYKQVSRPDVAAGNCCGLFPLALHHIELEWRF